jgi:proline dehydrogenase
MGLKETFILPLAKRWISGTELNAGIEDARKANARGMGAVLNFLGEEITDLTAADSAMSEYLRLQQAMADNQIRGHPSVKLTQLGLVLSQEEAAKRLDSIAANGDRLGQWLYVDMEGSKFTDASIAVYEEILTKHPHTGLALQAYMKRSGSDLNLLMDKGAKIRLVKGAYRESHDLVYANRQEIRGNYSKLMAVLFERCDHFAIATHDSVLVDEARKLAESSHAEVEFELLKGIRDPLKQELVSSGFKVSVYLPYGDRWYAYSKRRITEHPSNIWLLLRSLV